MKALYLIPARGGSKGIPGKNIRRLGNWPLIAYTLSFARLFAPDSDICVSTDSDEIIGVLETLNYKVPFKRSTQIAQDSSPMHEVLIDTISFYEKKDVKYDVLILLQPTSPFRSPAHLKAIMELYENVKEEDGVDMVASVGKSTLNPYFNLFEESGDGWLMQSKNGHFSSRQEAPDVYYFNGSIYMINTHSLHKGQMNTFKRIKKFEMDEVYSMDIDTELEWRLSENILQSKLVDMKGLMPAGEMEVGYQA